MPKGLNSVTLQGLAWATRREAAADLGQITGEDVTEQRVKDWQRVGCPPISEAGIPILPVLVWLVQHRRRHGSRMTPEEEGSADSIERLRLAQAMWAETKTGKLRGDLLDRAAVGIWQARLIEEMRGEFTRAAREAARRVQGQEETEAETIIADAILEVLERIADRPQPESA